MLLRNSSSTCKCIAGLHKHLYYPQAKQPLCNSPTTSQQAASCRLPTLVNPSRQCVSRVATSAASRGDSAKVDSTQADTSARDVTALKDPEQTDQQDKQPAPAASNKKPPATAAETPPSSPPGAGGIVMSAAASVLTVAESMSAQGTTSKARKTTNAQNASSLSAAPVPSVTDNAKGTPSKAAAKITDLKAADSSPPAPMQPAAPAGKLRAANSSEKVPDADAAAAAKQSVAASAAPSANKPAERIELPLKGQQAGPPTARQLWARGVLFTDVRALGISKKNIKEVLDKVVMLVTVQNKKQLRQYKFYHVDGMEYDSLGKLQKRLQQDAKSNKAAMASTDKATSASPAAASNPPTASKSAVASAKVSKKTAKQLQTLESQVLPTMREFNVPEPVLQVLQQHVSQGGQLSRKHVALQALCLQVRRFCPLTSALGAYQGLLTCLSGIAWVTGRSQLPVAGGYELQVLSDEATASVQVAAAGLSAADAFKQLTGAMPKSFGRVLAGKGSLFLVERCPWIQVTTDPAGLAAPGAEGTAYSSVINWGDFFTNTTKQTDTAVVSLLALLKTETLGQLGAPRKQAKLAAAVTEAVRQRTDPDAPSGEVNSKTAAATSTSSSITPADKALLGFAACAALDSIRKPGEKAKEALQAPGRLVLGLSNGISLTHRDLVEATCELCPKLVAASQGTPKKKAQKQVSAALQRVLEELQPADWEAVGADPAAPVWRYHLAGALQQMPVALAAVTRFMPSFTEKLLNASAVSAADPAGAASVDVAPVTSTEQGSSDSKVNQEPAGTADKPSSDSGSMSTTSNRRSSSSSIDSSDGTISIATAATKEAPALGGVTADAPAATAEQVAALTQQLNKSTPAAAEPVADARPRSRTQSQVLADTEVKQAAAADLSMQQAASKQQLPTAAQKLGPLSALEYEGPLPGLAELQVIEVCSASDHLYKQMLAHIAASRVIGADLEPAKMLNGQTAVAIISLMVPAASGQGRHWPDTVYIVDLVAAGLLSYGCKADINKIKQSQLMRGLAAVLQDQGILVAMCDSRWDAVALKECCGIGVCAIDVQACWIFLVTAGVKSDHTGQHINNRRSLTFLLGQYGLLHPNKDDVAALNRNVAQDGEFGRFFAAPRPLNNELLNYAASDVRYLPALVLLMERDMLRAYPGRLMQELQQQLKSKVFKREGRDGSLYLGSTLHQQLAGWMGPVSVLGAAEPTDRLAESTTEANRDMHGNRLLTLPDAFDMRASAFLFWLQMPSPAAAAQPLYDSSSMQAGYELLVPHAAMSAAQAAATGVSTVADGGTETPVQPQQQQRHCQESLQELPGQQPPPQQQETMLQASGAWELDEASNDVMSMLGTELSKKVENDMHLRIKQLSKRYDPDSVQQLQLRELFVLPGGKIKYCLAPDSMLAAVPAAATKAAGAAAQGFVLNSRFKQCYEVAGVGNHLGDQQLLEGCLERLAMKNGWTEHKASFELLKTSQSSIPIKGTLHRLVPIKVHSNTQQQSSSNSSSSITSPTSSKHDQNGRRSNSSSTDRISSNRDAEAVQGTAQHAQAVAAEAEATIHSKPLAAAAAAAATAGDGSVLGLHFYVGRTQPGLSLVLADALARIAVAAGSSIPQHQQALHQTTASTNSSSSSSDHNSPTAQAQGAGLGQWSFGLGSFLAPTAAAAARASAGSADGGSPKDSPVDVVPGHLLLLFAPQRSGKSSMLWDAAQQLSGGWGCDVAVIDIQGLVSPQCGTALHLPASSPNTQAAAITAAWQQHGCRVVVCEHIDASPAVVQAVQAALAAGCSVVAAAQGVAALAGAAGHAAAAAASQEGYQPGDLSLLANGSLVNSGSSSSNSVQPTVTQVQRAVEEVTADLQPTVSQQQQQGHAGAAALWRLVVQLAQQRPGDCTVVDCHRTYRWHIHCNLQQTIKVLPAASNQYGSSSAVSQLAGLGRALSGSASGYVLPVEVRELVHAQGVLGQAAAVVDASGVLHSRSQGAAQQAQQQQQHQHQQEDEQVEEVEDKEQLLQHSDNAQHVKQQPSQMQTAGQQGGSMPADNGEERHHVSDHAAELVGCGLSPVVVARFSTYGAAAAVLPGGLQECVRRLLHPEGDS